MLFTFREESFHVEVNKLCKMSHACLTGLLVDRRAFVQDSYKTVTFPGTVYTRGFNTRALLYSYIFLFSNIEPGSKGCIDLSKVLKRLQN